MKVFLNYAGVFHLQYSISNAEAHIKGIVNDMIRSQYLPVQSRLSYVRYVRFGLLMTKNADVFPPLEAPNENREDGKKLGILYLNKEGLHVTRCWFVVLLIEAGGFYIIKPTESTVFHAPSFYRFGEPLL